jgi:hypothetical protein
MSRGFGKVQTAILEQLRRRKGGDVVEAHYEPQVRLARGVHDMRAVSAEMNTDELGFADARKQAAFSRALTGLVESGAVTAHSSLVPIAEYWPHREWTSRVLVLADGTFLSLPGGAKWRRRFVSLAVTPE